MSPDPIPPDKVLRSIVVYPRDGIDARMLGMAVVWGLVADVSESVAQSQICEVKTFFDINAFDLTKVIEAPALERFKIDYRERVAGEWQALQRRAETRVADLERERDELAGVARQLGEDLQAQQREAVAEHNRAEAWRLAAGAALVLGVVAHFLLRLAGV